MINLLKSELLKHKGTLALFFVFAGPALIVLLMGIQTVMWGVGFAEDMTPARFFIQNNLTLWSFLMLPFFITLITALSAYPEHKNKMWNILLIGDVPRVKLFTAKLALTILLVVLSYLAWLLFIHVGAALLSSFMNKFGLWTVSDSQYVFEKMMAMTFVTVPMVIIHFWIANRFSNILVAFGFGVVITIVNFMIASSSLNQYLSWSLPLLAAQPNGLPSPITNIVYVVILSILLSVGSVLNLTIKEYY